MKYMLYILAFFYIGISCDRKSNDEMTANSSEKFHSSTEINFSKDSLEILFDSLALYNFNLDTSFLLKSDTYLTNITYMIVVGQEMNLKSCECVDSVKIFKFQKDKFDHKKNMEYYSFPLKDFNAEVWLNIWYFDKGYKALNCYNDNKEAFTQNDLNILPQESFVMNNTILSISSASLKETELYKEFINIIQSLGFSSK